MHYWQRNSKEAPWQPKLTIKGHFGEVSDLDWDHHHLSLFTTSTDQTTRIFAEY
jgi:elongator complex protein 2